MVRTCKCCGHPLPDEGVLAALTPLQRRVFTAIQRAGPAGVPASQLMDIVYADDPTGGPVSTNIISVVANQMKPRLIPFGVQLRGKRGAGGYYVLEKLEGKDAAE
jgi:hypothetical protein